MSTLRAPGLDSTATTTKVKFKEPKRWSSIVPPAAVPSTEFTGGQEYIKRWRLPPPLDPNLGREKSSATPVKEAEVTEPVTEEQIRHEEEEGDDLEFLRSALRVSSND